MARHIGQILFQEFQASQDHAEQVVEVVRHPAGELAHRLHLLRLQQLRLGLLAPRDVAHGADEAPAAGALGKLLDLEIHRELAAVPAAAPHLAADADDLGDAGLEVPAYVPVVLRIRGRRHQDRDIAPDQLARRIAEYSLGRPVEGEN